MISMHSSTFSSEKQRVYKRASFILLSSFALMAICTEIIVRVGFNRFSRIQRTFVEEYHSAIEQGRHPGASVRILIVGNSLLEAGMDYARARREMAPLADLRRIVVSDTNYYDWEYGLRRLFSEGAHPDLLILCLTAHQLTSSRARGDYFAHYLMRFSDIGHVSSDLHLSPTQITGYFFANLSNFLGARSEIRKWIIGVGMPEFQTLAQSLAFINPPPQDQVLVEKLSGQRLAILAESCREHGVRFALLLPPLISAVDNAEDVRRAATQSRIEILVPLPSASLPVSYYRDGFHLNSVGAAEFTTRLVRVLRNLINGQTEREQVPALRH